MSVSAVKTDLISTNRSSRSLVSAPTGARAWLSTLTLPALAVLDFQGPAALWSSDRSRGVLNSAATALLRPGESDGNADADLWIQCIDSQDRERVRSAWQSHQDTVVCSYRLMPSGAARAIELREIARRLSSGAPGEFVVLSRFELLERRGEEIAAHGMRSLIHQIGNHLQSIRSEADLSRLFGALSADSFGTIVRGIDSIQRLVAQLESRDVQAKPGEGRCPPAGVCAAPRNADLDEVEHGRS